MEKTVTWHYTVPCGLLYFVERMWREIRARRKTDLIGVLMVSLPSWIA